MDGKGCYGGQLVLKKANGCCFGSQKQNWKQSDPLEALVTTK
jgi:hypothetical protein